MKLIECKTCGSHEFNGNKCAYCGNVYEMEEQEQEQEKDDKLVYYDDERPTYMTDRESLYYPYEPPVNFEDTAKGKKTLKVMIWLLVSIIWFAVTIFIPPLFLLTICGLIIWGCKWLIKKGEKNNS